MPDVWFTRHGECIANIGAATRSAAEADLTDEGRKQALFIADYLQQESIDPRKIRIISSPYTRAIQTAQPTRERFSEPPFAIWPAVHEFDYLSLPPDVPTTSAERLPLVRKFWGRCDPSYQHKGAESFSSFIGRVLEVLQMLREFQEDKLTVVFSHHQFIQAVKWLLGDGIKGTSPRPEEMKSFYQFLQQTYLPNGVIVKVRLGPDEEKVQAEETSHLAGTMAGVGR